MRFPSHILTSGTVCWIHQDGKTRGKIYDNEHYQQTNGNYPAIRQHVADRLAKLENGKHIWLIHISFCPKSHKGLLLTPQSIHLTAFWLPVVNMKICTPQLTNWSTSWNGSSINCSTKAKHVVPQHRWKTPTSSKKLKKSSPLYWVYRQRAFGRVFCWQRENSTGTVLKSLKETNMKHTPFSSHSFYLPWMGGVSSCETECEEEQ